MLTFAESTRRTYNSQMMLYLQFCGSLNFAPVPISQDNLGRYIAFLANRLCYSSVRQYLNIVRLMHLDEGFANPLLDSWYLSSILKGIKRHKGVTTHQKLPITWNILHGILAVLNLSCTFDLAFWAACLVAFFCFFRKSNLLVQSMDKFDPKKHLCRTDVQFSPTGAVISVRWSKTIQFQQKILHIPLPHITTSPFCPSSALYLHQHLLPCTEYPLPLFCYISEEGLKPITHAAFVSYLRDCLQKLGLNPNDYSGHSFRRGGCSYALECGLPTELIKLQGDWASNAYEKYIDPSFTLRQQVASTLGKAFPHLPVTGL